MRVPPFMMTGDIKNQIDRIWDAFWSGGISNPLEVIEQITYLLFLRRLDDIQTLEENKSNRLKTPMKNRVFPEGKDEKGMAYDAMRWSKFKHEPPAEMYTVVAEHIFPFLRKLRGDDSTYAHHMKDARFTIPTPGLLAKVVDLLDKVPMNDRDTKGDLYEYMLGKIATAGQNGQFRTPRHIIQLMVEMTAPVPGDTICDPACGTAGFLVGAGEYLRERYPKMLHDEKVLSIVVGLPPLPLQKTFAARIAAIDSLKQKHKQAEQLTQNLFQSLQHRAFRGEL